MTQFQTGNALQKRYAGNSSFSKEWTEEAGRTSYSKIRRKEIEATGEIRTGQEKVIREEPSKEKRES